MKQQALKLSLFLLYILTQHVQPAQGKLWKQDDFLISAFRDPTVPPSQYLFEYQRMKACNFTTMMAYGLNNANSPDLVQQQIDAASKAGLKIIPNYCNGKCLDLNGTWGFFLKDEPNARRDFSALAKQVADVKSRGGVAFINLFPNYGSPYWWGAPTYENYTQQYMETVKPNVLAFDHYPDFDQDGDKRFGKNKTTEGYISNLLHFRELSMSVTPHLPVWNYMDVEPYNGGAWDVSEAEIRWQVYTALATGVKGIMYFAYWSIPQFPIGHSIMTLSPNGNSSDWTKQEPSEKYYIVKRINSKLLTFGRFLLPRVSSAVVRVNGTGAMTSKLQGLPWMTINGTNVGPSWKFMLGAFDSNQTILIVNQDSNHPLFATVSIDAQKTDAFREIDPSSGAKEIAIDDAPAVAGFQIYLLAGDARLFTFL